MLQQYGRPIQDRCNESIMIGERDWAQLQPEERWLGIYRAEGRGSVDGKVLRSDIKDGRF